MKIYVKSSTYDIHPVIVDMEVVTYHPILDVDTSDFKIASTIDLSKYKLPKGRVIAKEKHRITQRMIEEFEEFMEFVEDYCEYTCKLIGTYKNVSNDHSHYYNYLATTDSGEIIIDYRLRLRISNHEPHSTKQQKANKKKELESEILHKLFDEQEIGKLTSYPKIITINDEKYKDYKEAMEEVVEIIDEAVKVMKHREKYRPTKSIPEDLLDDE